MRPLTRQLGGPTPTRSSLSFAPNSGSVRLEVSELLLRAHSGPSARMPAVSPGEERDCPSTACLHSYSELQLPWARSCPGPRAGVAGRWAGRWGSTERWNSHPRHGPRGRPLSPPPPRGNCTTPPRGELCLGPDSHRPGSSPILHLCWGPHTHANPQLLQQRHWSGRSATWSPVRTPRPVPPSCLCAQCRLTAHA